MNKIEKRVAQKLELLDRYREAAGEGVRLPLVANRMFDSGRLKLVEESTIDTRGFQAVYFLSFPESVTVFQGENV